MDAEELNKPVTNTQEAMARLEAVDLFAQAELTKPSLDDEKLWALREVISLATEARNLLKGFLS